jgi:hypothetical protein
MARDGPESELRKYIKMLEARVEELEKKSEARLKAMEKTVQERLSKASDKWFKRTATEGSVMRELRMVLMGPPGAGTLNCLVY